MAICSPSKFELLDFSAVLIEEPHSRLLLPNIYSLATSVPLKSLKRDHLPLACVQIAATRASC
jgi:hypothetical protein